MSFADDLWDGFAAVAKWEQQGTAMCKAICRFYRKRAKIEETYGKSMFKLVQQITDEIQQAGSSYCNDTICYGTLGSGWIATCHNAQVQAELHLNFAEQIRKNIVENLQVNTLQLEDQLKQITKDGDRLLVDQEQWLATLKKTKQAYYKAVKEAEAAKSVFDESIESKMFSSKAEKRVSKASQEAQTAELAYHAQIKHSNNFMSSFQNELMPRVMKRLEDIGRSRQQLLLHHFKELSRISQEMPNGLSSAANALAKAINSIDVQKDVQDFIKFNKTNQQRPQPFQYEPPSEDVSAMDAKKGKHFFTLARKIKGSPPPMKGNPGSPPSLSPSSSALFIREKAFKFAIFGNSLDEIMGHQKEMLPDCDIPYFLLVLALDILRSNAVLLEGVFRVPAPTNEIENLARQFDNGNYDLSAVQSPYTTTHLIKKWCRDLPDPLIPSYLYERCIGCTSQDDAREVLPMIPPLYNKVVVFLAQLLHEFSLPAYSEQSKMNATNFAMVFTPSFLRCASTDMADFLLNVHREKNFVQLLIEGIEERITPERIEQLMAPFDDIMFTKDGPKWNPSKRDIVVPALQLNFGGEVFNSELKSELQRQASEREMILVKQQQLRKLTAKEDLSDPKVLHARLLDERAEKERFQDSLQLKDKTIQVMRTELSNTLQEKLHLENAVKSLQLRIEKLETAAPSGLSLSPTQELAAWSPLRINVKENIQNYEQRTRSFRSGSVDTGVYVEDRLKARSSWHKLHRSLSPQSPKEENRNTVNMGDFFTFKLGDSDVIAPFKLPISPPPGYSSPPYSPPVSPPPSVTPPISPSPSPPLILPPTPIVPRASSPTPRPAIPRAGEPRGSSFRSFLAPLLEEPTSPRIISPSPTRNVSSAPTSPRRDSDARLSPTNDMFFTSSPASPVSPRRDTIASPRERGVSFRDLNTVHVYQPLDTPTEGVVTTSALITDTSSSSSSSSPNITDPSPRQEITSPRVPRIKIANLNTTSSSSSSSSSSSATSPRSPQRHTVHASPRHASPPPTPQNLQQADGVNSPRNPRHSTPAASAIPSEVSSPRLLGINTISFGTKKEEQHPSSISRTLSLSGKRRNLSSTSTPSTSKKEEKKLHTTSTPDKKGKQSSSIDDQRIFDLQNTNVQKYDALSKKEITPASPKSITSSFPFKLRLLIQKQSKSTPELPASAPALIMDHNKNSSKFASSTSITTTTTTTTTTTKTATTATKETTKEESQKSPRSPSTSPRPKSPRNKPYRPSPSTPLSSTSFSATQVSKISPPRNRSISKNTSPPKSPVLAKHPSPPKNPASLSRSAPLSPRALAHFASASTFEENDTETKSPRQSRRTLSFPTPRAHATPTATGSSITITSSSSTSSAAHVPMPRAPTLAQSPRPTRSQTFLASGAATTQELHFLALEVDKMKKEVHKRLCACVEAIGNTLDYTQTIEISKSIRLLIKCLDLALSKLGLDERQMRQLGTGKSSLPEMKPLAIEDSRLKKLREVLVISLDRIVDQMRCLVNITSQITMHEDVNIVTQTLGEMQLFFSKQDQTISKIGPQEMVEIIHAKIEELKATWQELSREKQSEIAKKIMDLKKDIDEFCAENALRIDSQSTMSTNSGTNSQSERITKTIFSTLDKIKELCVVILQNIKHHSLRQSFDSSEDGLLIEKLLEIFKSVTTK